MSFIHLNIHSEFSIDEGMIRIDELIAESIKQKMPSIGLTDNMNLFGMIKFFQAAVKKGIKPIIGAELEVYNDYQKKETFKVICFCQDQLGYKNLCNVITKAYISKKESDTKACIQKEWFTEYNNGLIIVDLGCDGDIGQALSLKQKKLASTRLKYWQKLFGDRFYLGISRVGNIYEKQIETEYISLAQENYQAMLALNRVCFLKKEDFYAHEAKNCIMQGVTLKDNSREKKHTKEQYFKSQEEMKQLFSDLPETTANTIELAKRCNLTFKFGEIHLPKFPVPQKQNIANYFAMQARKRLNEYFQKYFTSQKDNETKYRERLETEIKIINDMGFAGYFLIVADFIQWAKDHNIPVGPGRGSGAGSLVAYCLGITGIDPLKYDLLFERFLNPERISMPDFDIDFCMEGRDRVIDYVARYYGHESVAQIITYGTMTAKAVIRDVGRVLGYPYIFVDKIAKLIPMELGITLDKALKQEKDLKKHYNDEEVKTLIDLAKKLEGLVRNVGKHAGGVVISPSRLTNYTPLYAEDANTQALTQFDKNDVETIGLVKFDFLGLRTLTIINWAINMHNDNLCKNNTSINIENISLNDSKTFELLQSQHTTAVFQLESRGMRDLIKRLKPDCFEDLIALIALFRPGPLQSGMVDDFINRKLGRAKIIYPHPELESILKPTYGVILYQEQVMQIAQVLAGYTPGRADLLRRAMGKKKPEDMAKQRSFFIKGATKKGVDKERATYIFDLMEKFAGYGFNKSHSAAYAFISFQTAWIKAHYPQYFMAAVLSSEMSNIDKIAFFFEECQKMEIVVKPPNINLSCYRFTVQNGHIIWGLGAIRGVGEAAINIIIIERNQNGFFTNIYQFCSRLDHKKVSRKTIEAFINSGALDVFGDSRALLNEQLDAVIKYSERFQENVRLRQSDLFDSALPKITANINRKIPRYELKKILKKEKETLGIYLSGHPISEHMSDIKSLDCISISNLGNFSSNQKKVRFAGLVIAFRSLLSKKGERMGFVTLEDLSGRQEVAIFSSLFKENINILKREEVLVVEGSIEVEKFNDRFRIRANKILSLNKIKDKHLIGISCYLLGKKLKDDNLKMFLKIIEKNEDKKGNGIPLRLIYKKHQAEARFIYSKKINCDQISIDELKKIDTNIEVHLHYDI